MSDGNGGSRSVVSLKTMDVLVALIFFAFGLLVAWDSHRLGAKWAEDGPQSGYFPFYVGLIICFASLINVVLALRVKAAEGESFVSAEQLKLVLSVAIPTLFYVLVIQFLGIYAASTLFIAVFMMWLGKYGWLRSVLVGCGVSVAFFLMFEIWFHVPLPKGPIEALIGLN
ncbi:MAG: tripartite tricarboxylate transporter TctB family protein [Betaproteobacteria bacterium]|nr:MAG: tripartite tricarboxylate transporter TctB family protein [Betaproteobacteria bacterium]